MPPLSALIIAVDAPCPGTRRPSLVPLTVMLQRRIFHLLAAACSAAAVVIIIPGGDPRPWRGQSQAAGTSADALLRASVPNEFYNTTAKVLMSTYDYQDSTNFSSGQFYPSGDSFVRGAIQAWGQHLHLVIRPEEVWFTILTQMNFYMQAHAEAVRNLFVSHKGQETIVVEDNTWYSVLRQFQFEIQRRVKTDWLLRWIQPGFSTTTENDIMVSNILMMGLMKAYFRYEGAIICGLPSVTLLGSLSDWEALLAKLDRLPEFGADPAKYRARLLPVLTRFVESYRNPNSKATKDFWNQIARASRGAECGAPPVSVSGWITAFFFWDASGEPYARRESAGLELDGVRFPSLSLRDLPVGYAGAPFTMRDFGGMDKFPAYVLAGTLGKRIRNGAPEDFQSALRQNNGSETFLVNQAEHGTLQAMSAWMLYGPVPENTTIGVTRGPQRDFEMSSIALLC
jgi:hypothetical protein